jgi:type IV secretory pathway VirB2 component (pilin)
VFIHKEIEMKEAKVEVAQPKKSAAHEAKEWVMALGVCLLMASASAIAQSSVADDELGGGICRLVNFLTGKWLFGLSILATLGAGAALMFGAELTDGIKKIATIITIVGIILSMSSILAYAFNKFSAQSCS